MAVRKAGQRARSKAVEATNRVAALTRTKTAKPTATPAARISRGPVDAPGKHHRKPPPQERIDRLMGEPTGKKMGQKSVKTRGRGGF